MYSTSAVVPTPFLISASEGKFQSFPFFGVLFGEQIRTVTRHFLGQGLPPFNRFLKFLRKKRQIDVCNISTPLF